MQKRVEGTGRHMQRSDGGALCATFQSRKGSALEDERDHETCATFVNHWWNLGEALVEPRWNLPQTFWQPKTHPPQRTRDTNETWRTLVERSAERFGSPRRICSREPKTPRNLEKFGGTWVKTWWNLGGNLAEPWWNDPRNLCAAQDGSAPENQRHRET